jgi:exonuclease III
VGAGSCDAASSPALEKQIKDAGILPMVKHSDHCPIVIELKK